MIDTLIRNGMVIDGTGAAAEVKEVAISQGKIISAQGQDKPEAMQEIDAKGKVVCPGFIDIHSHSDFTLLVNRNAESAVHQGITTLVTGNCGHGPAPCRDKELAKQVTIGYSDNWETDISWNSFGQYVNNLFSPGLAVNVAPLVPHGAIRMAVMGYDERKPSRVELDEMKAMVAEAMRAGAAGFSTGLEYSPGQYSEKEELIALSSVAARHGGIYASHIRNRADTFLEAIEEALTIIRQAGLPGQLSHLAPRPYANGQFQDVLTAIDDATGQEGLMVGIDTFPDIWAPGPAVTLLPSWVYEGNQDEVISRLASKDVLDRCRDAILNPTNYLLRLGGFESFYLTCSKSFPELVGKNFQEISDIFSLDPAETIFKLVRADGADFYNVMLRHIYATEEDLKTLLLQSNCSIESDGVTAAPYGHLRHFVFNRASYGYTIRFLQEYILEKELFTLEEGIRRLTSLPADSAGLINRGRIAAGCAADLVMLDLEQMADRTTDDSPQAYPAGIEMVMVNGEIVLDHDRHTLVLPGQLLPD